MRLTGTLLSMSVIALAVVAPSAAYASTANLVDGTVTSGDTSCSWADATTDANPPDTLTVDAASVDLTCADGTELSLNNSPQVSFDDAAGAATVDAINITGTVAGVSCDYEATELALSRDGDTRSYNGGPYTAGLVDGGVLCPDSYTLDTATVSFH